MGSSLISGRNFTIGIFEDTPSNMFNTCDTEIVLSSTFYGMFSSERKCESCFLPFVFGKPK